MFEVFDARKESNVDVLNSCANLLSFATAIMSNSNPKWNLELSKEAESGLCTILMIAEEGMRGVINAIEAGKSDCHIK